MRSYLVFFAEKGPYNMKMGFVVPLTTHHPHPHLHAYVTGKLTRKINLISEMINSLFY